VLDGVQSDSLEVHKSVPQGSTRAPVLFTVYRNAIDLSLKNSDLHSYAISLTMDLALSRLQSDILQLFRKPVPI
jgi:hypothetical protein